MGQEMGRGQLVMLSFQKVLTDVTELEGWLVGKIQDAAFTNLSFSLLRIIRMPELKQLQVFPGSKKEDLRRK